MPVHEIIVTRIPQEREAEPAAGVAQPQTVGDYRARYGNRIVCRTCQEEISVSGLEQVWEAYGPDAVIDISHRGLRLPGDPVDLTLAPGWQPQPRRPAAASDE